jgi:hypothetical protein
MTASLIRALLLTGLLLSFEAQAQKENVTVPAQSATGVEVSSVTVSASRADGRKMGYTDVKEFRETKGLHLVPATEFLVGCDLTGSPRPSEEDFVVWTTIDFLVAPATRKYEGMDINQLGASVSWGQVTEMHDVRAAEVHSLHAGQTTHLTMSGFDLGPVMAAFPIGDAGNLWPWLMRVTIHVQDRDGKPIAQAERIVRLWPDSVRTTN